MNFRISRGAFLKLSWLALSALAFRPVFPRQPEQDQGVLARVASRQVDVRARPNDEAPIVGNRFRDQLLHIYGEVRPADAPQYYNTLWYRVWGGYVHSAHLQLVAVRLQRPVSYVPASGVLCEARAPPGEPTLAPVLYFHPLGYRRGSRP
jgi:hypothetical protein